MSDAGRLAIAILIMMVAFIMYFFAFHPNGVEGADNPIDALVWLMGQFNQAAGVTSTNTPVQEQTAADAAAAAAANALNQSETPTQQQSAAAAAAVAVTNPFALSWPVPTPTGQEPLNTQLTGLDG